MIAVRFELLWLAAAAVAPVSCNNASMAGASGRAAHTTKADPADSEPELGTEAPGKPSKPGKPEPAEEQESGPAGDADTADVIRPDDVVDGEEVIRDCRRCTERAKQLSTRVGFEADISRTYNLGFYKIPPDQNLCDIHFMADMSIRIDDHEGKDSILNRQIAVYCPCDCGWASTTPPLGNIVFP